VFKQKVVAVAVLAGAGILGLAAPAVAGNGGFGPLATGASSFDSASVYWHPNGDVHGAMEYSGYLRDTKGDSNSVYAQGKVSGYDWESPVTNSNGSGSSIWVDHNVWDPAATRVDFGWVQACVDDSYISDTCSGTYLHR
jgi:hypothetical protein